MASERLTPIEEAKSCIRENQNFLFQGGAGSGKTESLKDLLKFLSEEHPEKKVVCITHTNKAVEEIQERVKDEKYTISTIHSFLHYLIKDYKKNIHEVIYELFRLERVESDEHKEYKRIYVKYADKLYSVKGEKVGAVIGKKIYDANKFSYINELNENIEKLNHAILEKIKSKNDAEINSIKYNETKFNSFKDLTYGHDGLLEIAILLFSKYPRLNKILQDKVDCVFIDEYQDAKKEIIDIFLSLPKQDKITVGLFGDSMQSIYLKDTEIFQNSGLNIIRKKDNFRCSYEVVNFINAIRNDGLQQEVAFKTKKDSKTLEAEEERHGEVKFYYKVVEKPRSPEEKEGYIQQLDTLIAKHSQIVDYKILKLTNKSIARDAGFGNLFEVFNSASLDPIERLEKHLARLQLEELCELCDAYEKKNYNFVLSKLRKQKMGIKALADKKIVKQKFDDIFNSNTSIINTIKKAFDDNLTKQSEKFDEYLNRRNEFLESLTEDEEYKEFKNLYEQGKNTYSRIKDDITISDFEQVDFDELENKYKKEVFYNDLFSDDLRFIEVLNYYKYQREELDFVTMHKTKGTGINNVLIVLDEYFWPAYDFKAMYMDDVDPAKRQVNTNLFYVACSRAIKNLTCIKLITEEEKAKFLEKFGSTCIEDR